MRILHTADWHVGKSLKGVSRLDEQEQVLREIVAVARAHEVDAVLIAGDLYDSAAPSASAQRLVVRTLTALAGLGAQVVVIAGNHDHAATLDAYRPFAQAAGITMVGSVRTAASGGVVEFTAAGEQATVAVLPFLSQRYAVKAAELVAQTPAENSNTYDQRVREIVAALTGGFRTDAVNLVMAHLTVLGGTFGGGERAAQSIFEYAVPAAVFPPDAHYVALGHLHRRQALAAPVPVHYPGAPLAVDFGEQANTSVVLLVEATPTTPARVTEIPITAGRRLRTVAGTLPELATLVGAVGDDLLRIRVREYARAGLREEVTDLLPNALEVRIDPEFAAPVAASRPAAGPGERSPGELFGEYLGTRAVDDARVEELFARLHDRVSSTVEGVLMRPVRLEMHGFAAFREPTVVDFAGAEYFALVGPTGSGKSTVIDALTFALYGTVPRWDDRRAVALALAPSVVRGVVRLVFDVRDARYVAARELRRAPRGGVNVKNARLERLVDRDDLDGPTDALATDSGVTRAVEQLLGLSFEHFTSCVVLPQGEFAEFLHAKPGDRQAILTRLLGLGVYERIAREANQEAAAAANRAALLADQLGAYADATDEAVAASDARVGALEVLRERVAALVPELAAAGAAVVEADAAVATLRAEQARLDGVAVPTGIAALDGRRRAAQERVDAARGRFGDAEAADDAARKLLADAPPRGPLERARHDHADLTTALVARPAAAAAHRAAAQAEEQAARASTAAEAAAAVAAGARDTAAGAHGTARETAQRLSRERAALAAVRPPAGLDVAARRQAEAVAALAAADAALADAEAADGTARARLAGAPARGPLEQARRDHAALADAQAAEPTTRTRHVDADRGRAEAATVVTRARTVLAAARAHRDAAARGDLAAAVRPSLVVGEPCPVCTQRVVALPPALPGADLAAHDAATAEAQVALEAALAAEAEAVAAERQAAAERDRVAGDLARLRAAVGGAAAPRRGTAFHGVPPDASATDGVPLDGVPLEGAAAVEAALADLDALAEEAAAADAAARAARRARGVAAAAADAVRAELAAAATALRAARDPVVVLGAPAGGDDPAAGWAALTAWAAAAVAERDAALPDAERAASAVAAEADRTARAAEAAAAQVAAHRQEATVAARVEQQARSRVEALDERVAALEAAVAGAPPPERIDADLARLDGLEAGARTADVELRAARAARAEAEQAAEVVRREVEAGRDALRAARDPLVTLGAPGVDGVDLAASWTALTSWAATESAARAARLPGATAGAEAARAGRAALRERLAAALVAEGVLLEGPAVGDAAAGRDPATGGSRASDPTGAGVAVGGPAYAGADPVSGGAAEAAVAAALARGRAVRDRFVERRAEAANKRAERAAAEEAQQVARMLGGLLRSDKFPRWLVASALDALVADASTGLAELSGGQFELTHDEGEFLVVDHADADARRPVKTLSGGETFQASLALALALSAQMSSLAAEGAARLDSIFLDEGFGTLDEANLDVVAGTLENLASRGDRMVGVITHVPGLAERVPVRFLVRRDQRSARIEREGADVTGS